MKREEEDQQTDDYLRSLQEQLEVGGINSLGPSGQLLRSKYFGSSG